MTLFVPWLAPECPRYALRKCETYWNDVLPLGDIPFLELESSDSLLKVLDISHLRDALIFDLFDDSREKILSQSEE
jgi:hypothetical protein